MVARRVRARRPGAKSAGAAAALALAACSEPPPDREPVATEVPEDLLAAELPPPDERVQDQPGTPLEERVATLGVLNKRNNITQDVELRPGESRRLGDLIVRLATCERTAPWEMPQETGGFVQVLVQGSGEEGWEKVFSGWLFLDAPSLNVVEHPIYDVWIKDCAMRFPGEEDEPAPDADADSEA